MGDEAKRNLVVELRDYDRSGPAKWSSVWISLGTIGADIDWQHLSVTIGDTGSTGLPEGWKYFDGSGKTALPDGVTFASMLQGVDEIAFTTMTPYTFNDFRYFDISVDNISISAVPEPSSALLLALGLIPLAARRRAA